MELLTLLRIADLSLSMIQKYGVSAREIAERREQRLAEGKDGLQPEDLDEYANRAQAAINRLPSE